MGVEITRTSQSHPELVSGSHCEPILILHRGQILKRVQDDHQQKKLKAHYSLLTTQRPSAKTGNGNPHPQNSSDKNYIVLSSSLPYLTENLTI